MTTFERVKFLADKQKISIVDLEIKLGFGKNSLYSWKKKMPNSGNLEKVADFFGVSTDYLLGRTDNPNMPDNDKPSKFTTLAAHAADRNHEVTDEELTQIEAYLDGIIDSHEKNNEGK